MWTSSPLSSESGLAEELPPRTRWDGFEGFSLRGLCRDAVRKPA
jgi:hypothetical protein